MRESPVMSTSSSVFRSYLIFITLVLYCCSVLTTFLVGTPTPRNKKRIHTRGYLNVDGMVVVLRRTNEFAHNTFYSTWICNKLKRVYMLYVV